MLTLRKRADRSKGERVVRFDEETGERKLVNPATPGTDHEPWPLAGVELVGDAPKQHNFADSFVARALRDGYLEFKNPRAEVTEVDGVQYSRNPVVTGDEIVLNLATGKLRYRVVEPPGRYRDKDGSVRESHEYRCRLVKGG